MKRENKGITLIALVITIVLLLILAGITIVALIGENGLLNRTQGSKVESDKANEREQVNLALMTAKVNENGIISKKTLKEELDKIEGMTGVPTETQEFPWTVIGKTGEEYKINENGLESMEEDTISFSIDYENNGNLENYVVPAGTVWSFDEKLGIDLERELLRVSGMSYVTSRMTGESHRNIGFLLPGVIEIYLQSSEGRVEIGDPIKEGEVYFFN